MRASVIIPAHNGERYLRACLTALLAQPGDFDVTVVDNGSRDAGADLVAREFPQVRLIRRAAPLGFAAACNLGIGAARQGRATQGAERTQPPAGRPLAETAAPAAAEAIVLLNQDTVVDPGWLPALLRPLEADPRLGIVGSLARYPDGRFQHAGGQISEPLGYGANIAMGLARLPEPLPPPDYMAFLGTALRAAMLDEVGLLDEGFGAGYFEDADLCLRALAAGWGMALARDATLVHDEGAIDAAGGAGRTGGPRRMQYAPTMPIPRTGVLHTPAADAAADAAPSPAAQARAYRHTALVERNRLRLALKHRAPATLLGPFLAAEREQLTRRARAGHDPVLRQAYLHALVALPQIAAARGWDAAAQGAVADALAGLRRLAVSRVGVTVPAPEAPPSPAGAGEGGRGGEGLPAAAAPPPVAIIMLTWNGLAVTKDCIASIRAHTRGVDYRLIVVDNGSSDGTLAWLRAQPDITLIANDHNAGFTRGNNQGMAAAPPECDLLLLNNDTLITQDDWLARLREVAHADPSHGVVGCKLLWPDGRLQHAGTYMPDAFWGYQVGGGEADVGQYPGVREVQGVVGACMYIRRDVYDAIGGLDEAFFSYFEDSDYCLRAKLHGYKTLCVGDVRIVHRENTSTKLNNVSWQAMFGTARQTFIGKWGQHFQHERYGHSLLWHSIIASPTGYAVSSREFALELDRRGVDVRVGCIWGNDITEPPTGDPRIEQLRARPKDSSLVQVVYHQGDSFIKNSGRYRVGYSMLEPNGIPEDWAAQANQMDEVWVPSTFNARTFRDSGVKRPIHVVPLGVDPDYFHPGIAARRPSDRFVFLSNFEWGERKAPELLLRAFTEEFGAGDDAVLLLKVFNNDPGVNVEQQIADLRLRPGAPVVLMLNQRIAQAQMGSLYTSADCFVLPTRGEGWGMPILEAMACGLPTIATDWSAQSDFLDEEIAYPLRVKRLIPAVAKCPYYVGYEWADPDLEHLRHLMRQVYERRDEARAKGRRAAEVVARRWSWARAVDRIMERLDEIEA